MSEENTGANDPLAMLRKMWGNMGLNLPGMVMPTLDCAELDKRIADLKTVEGWLSMNLSMLQMTIRSLEMQNTTLRTVRAMGEMASNTAEKAAQGVEGMQAEAAAIKASFATPDAQVWPLIMMQQMQEYVKRQTQAAADAATEVKEEIKAKAAAAAPASMSRGRKKTSKP